jgi:hypothetical protein
MGPDPDSGSIPGYSDSMRADFLIRKIRLFDHAHARDGNVGAWTGIGAMPHNGAGAQAGVTERLGLPGDGGPPRDGAQRAVRAFFAGASLSL